MDFSSKIYIAGNRGMAGSAMHRRLLKSGYKNVTGRTSAELDLRDQAAVARFFDAERPEYVFIAAAKVGGIIANNTYRAEFLYDNLSIQNNIIHQAYLHDVKKLLFYASSCIYPKLAPQPMGEECLLTGPLEPTNEPYSIAKIAGIKMCDAYRSQYGCNFISVTPANIYGPNDNYDPAGSHVIPAMFRKFHEAKLNNDSSVTLWGDGTPQREFLHVDDLAAACEFLMNNYDEAGHVNVGTGSEISIAGLATLVKTITGFPGKIIWDTTKPTGMPRRLVDVTKLNDLGWAAETQFEEGMRDVYQNHFLPHYNSEKHQALKNI